MRRAGVGSSRDSSRASRSGGAVKITVSLIGEAFGVSPGGGSAIGAGRLLIEPVGAGSGTPASVEARDSSVACRRMICSSFCSNCSWFSNCRLVMRSTWARKLGDAVLVGELLLLLPRDQPRQHVVVEGEIGAGGERPAGHDHQAADRDPEADRAEPELVAGMGDACSRSGGSALAGALGAALGASERTTRPELAR